MPALAAHLRREGIRVSVRDLDLECLLWSLDAGRIAEAEEQCGRRRAGADPATSVRLDRVLSVSDYVLDKVAGAPRELRTFDTFIDPHRFRSARETINLALQMLSLANGGVDYSLGPVSYGVEGCQIGKLADLERVTADRSCNLFEEVFSLCAADLERDVPDIVGVSILNWQQVIPGLTLSRMLKERGHRVVIGGTYFAKFPDELLRRPRFFDLFCEALVPYEGETALVDLCERALGGRSFVGAPNVMALDGSGAPWLGPLHVEAPADLATPDFEGLPLGSYLNPVQVLPIFFGKGCYYNRCKFCDIPAINHISRKAYRIRPPELVAEDVVRLSELHHTRFFEMTDEALAPKLLLRLDEALQSHGQRDLRFVGYARFEPQFTAATCVRLHEMGFRKLFFGLESGSQRMLDHMDKGVTLKNAVTVLENCRRAGLAFHLFSIVGFPEEQEDDARQTARFFVEHADIVDMPWNSFDIHPFSLDLRTDYYERCEDNGILIDRLSLGRVDFPLSVDRWRNSRGLSSDRADELISELHDEIRKALPTWRRFPAHMWPGFEEYSIVYADHYERRPFGYRFTLPDDDDPTRYRISWAASTHLQPQEGTLVLWSLTGKCRLEAPLALLLGAPLDPAPPAQLVRTLSHRLLRDAERSEDDREVAQVDRLVRRVVDGLLSNGVLELTPCGAEQLRAS